MSPIISIIIPVYNTETYLKSCLNSVISQSYNNIEIICVNDGSPDGCQLILEEYAKKDERVRIVERKNGGRGAARNSGVEVATGKYILFLDSDDMYVQNTCDLVLQAMIKNDVDIVCFGTEIVGDAWDSDVEYYSIKYNGIITMSDEVLLNMNVSVCNKLFKRDMFSDYDVSFPQGLLYEDAEFFYKYVTFCKYIYCMDNKLLQYRRGHLSSIMSETKAGTIRAIDHICVAKNIYDFWQMNNVIVEKQLIMSILFRDFFNFSYSHVPKKDKSAVVNVAMDILINMPLIISTLTKLLFGDDYLTVFRHLNINYDQNEVLKEEDARLLVPLLISRLIIQYYGLNHINSTNLVNSDVSLSMPHRVKKLLRYLQKYGLKITLQKIIGKLSV